MNDLKIMATVPIFSGLSSSALESILSRMTKRTYRKNNMILMEDEFGDTFFIIGGGSVKITRVSEDGREVILAMLGEGDFFGEMSLLDGETRSANCIALGDSWVLMLRRRDFLEILEEYPKIAISLLAEMARRIRKSDEQIESLSLTDAQNRVGVTLLRLAEELGTIRRGVVRVNNLPNQQDIASMAGTSRETVSRIMRLLKEKKMIERRGHSLSILDYSQFRRTFG